MENSASVTSESGPAAVSQDSDEVRRIGAVLRGEGGEPGAADVAGTAGAAAGAADRADGAAGKGGGVDKGEGAGALDDDGDEAGKVAGDATGVKGDDDDKPLTLGEIAKAIGAKEGELFDQVQVEVDTIKADGTKGRESVSLGELRRGYIGAVKLERDRTDFEEHADKRSLEFMQTRAALEQLGELLAPHAPPEVTQRFQALINQRQERERALLLEAVPEWKDEVKFTADRGKMVDFLKPWGFSLADVYGITDHRICRFVRDMARDAGRKVEAERKARERNNGNPKGRQAPDGRQGTPPLRARLANIVNAGKAATTTEGKNEAIGALLRAQSKR